LLNYTPSETFALHNAYWIGYFLGPPLVGYWTLTREGFKATFIAGLAIYSCGAMSYWPSSVLKSYPGFFVSNLIVALGLSVLENAANPFVALAGPGDLSESRLCFSQAIQGVGSVISPVIARRALFSGLDENDLFRVQYCYLAVALFVVALAVLFFYVPLPEVSDDELEAMATQRLYNVNLDKGDKAYGIDARKLLLVSGIILMATYVGAQESVSYFWGSISLAAYPSFDTSSSSAIGMALFALGRFIASGLTYFFPPRHVLFGYMFGSFLTSLLAMITSPGPAALTFLILLQLFESAIFPLIFAMVLRGQGKHTKFAATGITMAISGGATWPSVVYAVDMSHMGNPRYSIRVTTALYAVATLWPVALSVNTVLRRWLDPAASRSVGIGDARGSGEGSDTAVDFATPETVFGKSLATHLEVMVEDAEDVDGKARRSEESRVKQNVVTIAD
jgi:fucose permease